MLCLLHATQSPAAQVSASNPEQLIVTHKGAEITVPVPDGYVRADHRQLPLDGLPQIQDRQILAAFVPKITAHNEYSVEPQPGHSRPSYYLVYRPRLDFAPASDPAATLTRLEENYYALAFEKVAEEQRYALQRLDEDSVSVTWVDLSRYGLQRDEEAGGSSINCINSIAYRKGDAILMFDALEACGLDAVLVKTHGEAWFKHIKSANEPLSYGRKLLAEKGLELPPEPAEAEPTQQQDGADEERDETAEAKDAAADTRHDFLWLLGGMLALILLWGGAQRWWLQRDRQ